MATIELMEEEEDDTSRLSELIALAEAGLHEEEEDDTSRLSELIALAEAGLHVAPTPFPSTMFVPTMCWISNVYRTGVRWPL